MVNGITISKWFMTQVTPESEHAIFRGTSGQAKSESFHSCIYTLHTTLQASAGPHTLGICTDNAKAMSPFNRVSFQV